MVFGHVCLVHKTGMSVAVYELQTIYRNFILTKSVPWPQLKSIKYGNLPSNYLARFIDWSGIGVLDVNHESGIISLAISFSFYLILQLRSQVSVVNSSCENQSNQHVWCQ